jgi:hypothetical protein
LATSRTIAAKLAIVVDGVIDKIDTIAVVLGASELEKVASLHDRLDDAVDDTKTLHLELAALCSILVELLVLLAEVCEECRAPMTAE